MDNAVKFGLSIRKYVHLKKTMMQISILHVVDIETSGNYNVYIKIVC